MCGIDVVCGIEISGLAILERQCGTDREGEKHLGQGYGDSIALLALMFPCLRLVLQVFMM